MNRIISLLVFFSVILSSINVSFAENETLISGLYPIKGDKIRLMSFESNLDFDTFIQDEEYILKNESDKAQNIEIGLNKDNGIRLPKVKVADEEVQLREAKDKYSFNIDLDKGEYKKIDLSYEVRVNNADEDCVRYNLSVISKWHKDILEFKMIYDLQEYIYPDVYVGAWYNSVFYDDFNRFIVSEKNIYLEDEDRIYLYIKNSWKRDDNLKKIRNLAMEGEYVQAIRKTKEELEIKEKECMKAEIRDWSKLNIYYDYIEYFEAEYYISDVYDESYSKNDLPYNSVECANELANKQSNYPLDGKIILLNAEKQREEPQINYNEREKEVELKTEYLAKLNKLRNEVEEVAPNSNVYVPKLDVEDIQKSYGRDEYRKYDQYDYNEYLVNNLRWTLNDLGATVICIPERNQLLSNKERIDMANENNVHMVITIGNSEEEQGCYIAYSSDKYVKDKKLNSINKKLSEYIDNALVSMEAYEYTSINRQKKQEILEKTIFNWSSYPIIGLKMFLVDEYGYYDGIDTYPIGQKIIEFFNDKDVQAYYKNHPRELEKQELELVKEKLKTGNKVTESEVMTEVEIENNKKNNPVLIIIGTSIAATIVAAILTFVVIKLIKRLRRKKDEQKENNSDSE